MAYARRELAAVAARVATTLVSPHRDVLGRPVLFSGGNHLHVDYNPEGGFERRLARHGSASFNGIGTGAFLICRRNDSKLAFKLA